MGLVTNIAEVTEYRHFLLSTEVLHQLENCMVIDTGRLEVSYNVAGERSSLPTIQLVLVAPVSCPP